MAEAVHQAARRAGASAPPAVEVAEATGGGTPRRRHLAAVLLLVTVMFPPTDAGVAQQLGTTLLLQPGAVLPPQQFGSVTVSRVLFNGEPLVAPPAPPPANGGSQTAVIGGAAAGGAAGVAGGCTRAGPCRPACLHAGQPRRLSAVRSRCLSRLSLLLRPPCRPAVLLGLLLWRRRRLRRHHAAPAAAPSRLTLQHTSSEEASDQHRRKEEASEGPLSAGLKAQKGAAGGSTQLGSIYVDAGGAEGADFQIGSVPAAGQELEAAQTVHGSSTAGLPASHTTTSGEPDSLAQLMSGLPGAVATPGGLTTAASLGPSTGPAPPDALAALAGELAAQEQALQLELAMLQEHLAQGHPPAAGGLGEAEEEWFTPASSLASGSPSPAASAASPPPSPTHRQPSAGRQRSPARRGTPLRPGSAAPRPGSSGSRRQAKVSPGDSPSPDTGGAAQPTPEPPVWLYNPAAGMAREQTSQEEEAGGRCNVVLRRLSSAVRKKMSQGRQG